MKLINDNLKIMEKYDLDKNSETYIVESLDDTSNKYFLEVLDKNIYGSLIGDYIDYYKTYKNLSHKYILKTIDFKRVESINLRPIYGNFYYMLTEYNKWDTLETINKGYTSKDLAKVFIKLFTVIDFLHFSNFSYDYLTPDNIYISDDFDIKLSSIGKIIGYKYEKEKQLINYKYISPELFKNPSKTNFYRDYYSLGVLLEEFLLPSIEKNDAYNKEYVNKMINNLKIKDFDSKEDKLKNYIKGLSSLFKIDFDLNYKLEREKLYFDINPIGIDDHIKKILDIDNSMVKRVSKVNGLIINGKAGTGKTKVLNEINNRLDLEGCNVYRINTEDNELKIDALKLFIIQLASALHLEYEFLHDDNTIYITIDSIKHKYNLNFLDDKYNLLNKIAESFINISRIKPVYISIGNLSEANTEIFNDMDFIISRIKIHNIIFLFSIDLETIESTDIKLMISNKIKNKTFIELKLSNLNEFETINLIKAVVGSHSFPLEFSKLLYKESLGNPRYLDILIKHFFDTGEMFIGEDGEWKILTSDLDNIYFPQNFTETIKTSFKNLSRLELQVLEITSCFESSAEGEIVFELLGVGRGDYKKTIASLMEKHILIKNKNEITSKLIFNEGELKRYVYNSLGEDKRIDYHFKLSELLLNKKANGQGIDFNSLIKHISGSGRLDLLYEIIKERIASEKVKNNEHIIPLLELLFSKLESKNHKKRLPVVEQIIDTYISMGKYSFAEPYIDRLDVISKEMGLKDKEVKAVLYRFEIYARTNNLLKAKDLSKKLRTISLVRENKEFLLNYIRIEVLYLQAVGRTNETIGLLKKAINLSNTSNIKSSLGDFYNLLGIAYYFNGQHERALENYELAIREYDYSPSFYNVVKPLSNIGSIYNEVFTLPKKALDYFLQSYHISVENNLLAIQSLLLNNIGEVYFNMADFENAEIYFKKSNQLSKLNKDRTMEYLATINLGLTNISREKLRDGVNIFQTLRRMNKQDPIIDAEINMKYLYFLGFFHTGLGDLMIGKKYSQVSADKSKDISLIEYMKSQSRVFYIDSILKMQIDQGELKRQITLYRKQGSVLDRAFFILNLAYLSLRLNEDDIFAYLIEEFNTIDNLEVLNVIEYDIKILNNLYSDDKDSLIESLSLLNNKDINLSISRIRYLSHLGKKFYDLELYDYAIKALLGSLDLFYKTTYDLGIDGFEEKLEFYYSIDKVKDLLIEVMENGFNIDLTNFDSNLKNSYGDLRQYIKALNKENILKIYNKNENMDLYANLLSLTLNFYGGFDENINQLLKFISLHTLADFVELRVFNYPKGGETSRYSYNPNNKENEINSVILKAMSEGENILINKSNDKYYKSNYEDYISKEQVALIGIPIYDPELDYNNKDKRNIYKKKEAYASLILSSSSGINLFDKEALEMVLGVSKLIHLNLENGKLYRKSNYDKLTGVLTRSSIERHLEELTKDHIEVKSNFAVMMLDIDKFKNVNDTYGHQVGDNVLTCIGTILKNTLRASDYVGRYGGEEFLIILDNINKENSFKVAKKILSSIEEYKGFGLKEKVTVSIGISKFPEHTVFKDELIYKADQALYYAKEVLRRNQVALWNSEMEDIENIQSYVHSIAFGQFANNTNNLVSLVDVALMNRQEFSMESRIFSFLGTLIDGTEAELASLLFISPKGLNKQYTRKIGCDAFVKDLDIDKELFKKAIKSNESFTLIDWNSKEKTHYKADTFDIKSLILSPLIYNGRLKGLVYLEVPLKRKEFTNNNIGFVETISGVFASNL